MNIALILSGGTGTRLGANIPKQYIRINDRLLISYCLEMFIKHEDIQGVWIVADPSWQNEILSDIDNLSLDRSAILGFSNPGDNRQLSILNGLTDIESYIQNNASTSDTDPVIIIHDAARPNLTKEFVSRCLNSLSNHDGLMPTLPMKDTVYISDDGHTITSLVDRSKVLAGQAPEFYRLKKYLEATKSLLPDKILNINGSTEPAILYGLDVITIPGDENNYKITTASDLEKFSSQVLGQ